MCVWQVKLCDPELKHVISECFRDEFLMIKCYTNVCLLYFRAMCCDVELFCCMTTRLPTPPLLRRLLWLNVATNYYFIHHIRQI